MNWLLLAGGAALSWGFYGALLHKGQTALANPLRALLCVGMAYFLIGVLVPAGMLTTQGTLTDGFNKTGTTWATVAGALGAIGAVFIIMAFKAGGSPTYVMPLVFAGAPVINVAVTMIMTPPKETPHPMLWIGFLMAAAGAGLTLYFRPH